MSAIEVRPFRRADRDQVTALVNAHIEAVLPGVSVSVNAVMSSLERESDEYVVDPWAIERSTLVAVVADRIVATAHLVRYGSDERVSGYYRNAGAIRWLVFWPPQAEAADAITAECLKVMGDWGVELIEADGSLPSPATYGLMDCWPHVNAAYERAGFARCDDHAEIILVADVDDLPRRGEAPIQGLTLKRLVGDHATRFVTTLGDRVAGMIELQTDLTIGGTLSRLAGWGDIWELHVAEDLRRRGIATWLVGHAADWLALARVQRLLHFCVTDEESELAFALSAGWRELARVHRGWIRS
ncbi:MAG: hypothetical protein QOI48_1555 [Solirubrobacteraceae bacterium]|jgi:ribosomal protein S18 acetylase RimI-like enzyme|nr:hypothetical protein [Solirubrobacteraceae bacterium]